MSESFNDKKRADYNTETRTDVLETSFGENVSRETLVSSKENKDNSVKKMYRAFRNNGLSTVESLYNALYMRCWENYCSSGVGVRKKYENVYKHPTAWFGNATTMWKHNRWTFALKLLEIPPTVYRGWSKFANCLKKMGLGLLKGAEGGGSLRKSAAMLVSAALLCSVATIGMVWWNDLSRNFVNVPVLQLYVNGKYAGNVRSVKEVKDAKDRVESSVSVSLGIPYVIDCDVEYSAVRDKETAMLTEAGLSKLFHEAAHDEMVAGYCLYKGDLPVCAVEDKQLLESCIEESIHRKFPQLVAEDNVRNIGYKDFVIHQGNYPEDLFVDESSLRMLLSLPEKITDEEHTTTGNAELTLDKTLITGGNSVGTSSDVANSTGNLDSFSVTMETVITKTEVVEEVIPYSTEYVYDDVLPEGLTTPISSGKNGLRTATYSVDYTDGKETSRRLLSEIVHTEPVNAVRKMGTRPLTEEEKKYKSTGTYIYPSPGSITSTYGWRVLGGNNEFHKGLDMMSNNGLDLVASDGGTVIQASDKNNGYGLCILIQHDDGTITRYAHCDELYVAETQKVKQGQLIAKMGATGYVTGVHVHFEIIKDGMTVNPMDYLIPR